MRKSLPGPALAVGWLAAFASIGGITNLLAFFFGLQVFRATNRVGIFLSAIVLFFLVVRLSRATASWPRGLRVGLAALAAAIGIMDQVPREPTAEQQQQIATAVAADRAFGRELEAALPAGAMLFQLPVQGFPEVTPPGQLTDYELFRPYLATETLRFSYGAAKFRARSRWQRDLENAPAGELVRRLEESGFAALYLNRKGFEDRADKLLHELAALGYDQRLQSRFGHQVVVRLHPAEHPQLPLARAFTYGQGWHLPAEGVRWAFEDAVMSYYNPFDRPISLELQLALVAVGPRKLTLTQEGESIAVFNADGTQQTLRVPEVQLHPGVNCFKLVSDRSAERRDEGRYQLRSFGVVRSRLRISSAPYALVADSPP
jgi:phosphoglycerol transferase